MILLFQRTKEYFQNNFKTITTETVQSLPKISFKGIEYIPFAWRNMFQISIWRVDEYGVVKTKSRYEYIL